MVRTTGSGAGVDCRSLAAVWLPVGLSLEEGDAAGNEVCDAVVKDGTGPVELSRTTSTAAQATRAEATASADHAATPAPVRHQTDRSSTPPLWHVVCGGCVNALLMQL